MIISVLEKAEKPFGQYTNLEVKGVNLKTGKETTQEIYSNLQFKWELVKEGELIELVMQNKGTPDKPKWQVADIKPITAQEAEEKSKPYKPQARASASSADREPAGEAVGMTVKTVWEMIRDNKLKEIFGEAAAQKLITWYRGQILGTTRISYDGASLPQSSKEPDKKILLAEIKAVIDECNWSEKDALKFCKDKKWDAKEPKELDQEQRKELVEYIRKNPK